jgi:hypothetical protein
MTYAIDRQLTDCYLGELDAIEILDLTTGTKRFTLSVNRDINVATERSLFMRLRCGNSLEGIGWTCSMFPSQEPTALSMACKDLM